MARAIGHNVERQTDASLLARAQARAALLPDLLVEARRVVNTVYAGWHGRKRRGVGENFWQFRPYGEGENIAAIDWRRSARDHDLFVRDREWQAIHTFWLWADESPSMLYRSTHSNVSKQERALVLAFAMAEILSHSGERIGLLGLDRPIVHRHAAERLATRLLSAPPQGQFAISNVDDVRDYSEVILFSDFLNPEQSPAEILKPLSKKRIKVHLVQIIDPAEESFPYSGRVEFRDPESGEKIQFGAAQSLKNDYRKLFENHCQQLADFAKRNGWHHLIHRTDEPASKILNAIHNQLLGDFSHSSHSRSPSTTSNEASK